MLTFDNEPQKLHFVLDRLNLMQKNFGIFHIDIVNSLDYCISLIEEKIDFIENDKTKINIEASPNQIKDLVYSSLSREFEIFSRAGKGSGTALREMCDLVCEKFEKEGGFEKKDKGV